MSCEFRVLLFVLRISHYNNNRDFTAQVLTIKLPEVRLANVVVHGHGWFLAEETKQKEVCQDSQIVGETEGDPSYEQLALRF